MPCLRQTSAVAIPDSCSFSITIICSSLNRDFLIAVSSIGTDSNINRRKFKGPGQNFEWKIYAILASFLSGSLLLALSNIQKSLSDIAWRLQQAAIPSRARHVFDHHKSEGEKLGVDYTYSQLSEDKLAEVMSNLSITSDGATYFYNGYKYTELKYAVMAAQRDK
jgi:hypothetical protein